MNNQMKIISNIVLLHFMFLIIGCNEQAEKMKDYTISENRDSIANSNNKTIEDNIINNKIGIIKLNVRNDTLEIISDQKLTWKPLGELLVSKLQENNKNIFKVNESIEIAPIDNQKVKFYKLIYNNSFIKVQEEKGDNELVSARILDSEINLVYDIKIGMSKKEFLRKIFVDPDFESLKEINVIKNFDPPGDTIDETFIFKGDTLSEIILQVPDTWVNKEL
jgi:hypothetical protein